MKWGWYVMMAVGLIATGFLAFAAIEIASIAQTLRDIRTCLEQITEGN